jgi:naphthalene 1,2-dioxygenase system ferredoxin subunit
VSAPDTEVANGFVLIGAAADFDFGCRVVEVHGEEVMVTKLEGQFVAVDAVCTHSFAYLSDGLIEGHEVVCPLHLGRFDLRTGQPTRRPAAEPLRVYPTRTIDGSLFVGPPQTSETP